MNATNHTQAGWLDLTRCALEYPISRRTLQKLIYAQRLAAYRLDGKILIRRADLESLLTATPVGVGADLNHMMGETAEKTAAKEM